MEAAGGSAAILSSLAVAVAVVSQDIFGGGGLEAEGEGGTKFQDLVLVFAEKSAMVFQAAGIGAAVVDFRGVVDAAIKLGGLAAAMGREFE